MKRGSHSWVHRSHDRKPYLESIAAFLNKELTQQLLFLSLWMSRSSLVSSRSSTFHLVTVLQVRWKDFFTFTLSLSQVPQEFTGDLFCLHRVFLLPQLQFAETQDECFSMLFRPKYSADYDMLLDTHLWKYVHGKHLACNFTLFRPLYARKETKVSLVYFKY
jgi:hypothetical protein